MASLHGSALFASEKQKCDPQIKSSMLSVLFNRASLEIERTL